MVSVIVYNVVFSVLKYNSRITNLDYISAELNLQGFFCFFAVRGPLTAVAPPAAEHRLCTRRLRGGGSRAQTLSGMWDPPGLGHKPASPASAGRLSTTVPPGKPHLRVFNIAIF